MKKIFLLTLAAAAATGAMAQSKLDASAQLLVGYARQAEAPVSRSGEFRAVPSPIQAGHKSTVFVTMAPGQDVADLEALGYEVLFTRDNMAIVLMNASEMMSAANLESVKAISLGYEARPMLFQAKQTTNADAVLSGSAEVGGKVYDGTGVVVGLMDGGLDINHPNFLKEDGSSRAKAVYRIQGTTSDGRPGTIAKYDTPTKIAAFTTDDGNESHATHVLGCMAGSFRQGYTKVSYINPTTKAVTTTETTNTEKVINNTDYRGAAPGADIIACCGTYGGANIATAAELVWTYAKAHNQPAVMNYSLGHNYGPHDGTDSQSQYLAKVGEDMIICVSAGNEGGQKISLHHDFTASAPEIKTFAGASQSTSGMIDIWGFDATKLKVTFQAYNKLTNKVDFSFPISEPTEGDGIWLTGNYYNVSTYIHDDAFDSAFGSRSALIVNAKVDPFNNRWNVNMSLQLSGGNSNYLPAIVVEGPAGKSVDIFAQGSCLLLSNNIAGFTAGNDKCSINGIATANNVVAVGAFQSTNRIPSWGGAMVFGGSVGQIASFSSYGTDFNGRQLPHVAGPGMGIISSLNSYWTAKQASDTEAAYAVSSGTGLVSTDKRDYYWGQMSGTSMSSPFVAGVIATWLQADPNLTYDKVIDCINATSTKDRQTERAPEKFGAGRIDALAGLKWVLNNSSGIDDVAVESSDFVVTALGSREIEVFAAGATGLNVQLYNMSGMLVAQTSASGDTATLEASQATAGVYILRSTTTSGRTDARKVVLR